MTYPNPRYNPEWETVHDHHAAERARAEAEKDRLARAGAWRSDAYRQAAAECDQHHQTCLAAIKSQHATVQEYAAWLFSDFSVDSGDWERGGMGPILPSGAPPLLHGKPPLGRSRVSVQSDRVWRP